MNTSERVEICETTYLYTVCSTLYIAMELMGCSWDTMFVCIWLQLHQSSTLQMHAWWFKDDVVHCYTGVWLTPSHAHAHSKCVVWLAASHILQKILWVLCMYALLVAISWGIFVICYTWLQFNISPVKHMMTTTILLCLVVSHAHVYESRHMCTNCQESWEGITVSFKYSSNDDDMVAAILTVQ